MRTNRSKLERNKRVKRRRRGGRESLHPPHPRERAYSRSSTRTMSLKDNKPKKSNKDSVTLLPCFYFVELPIVACSMISLYLLELTDILQPVKTGFRCFDQSLSKPYVETGDELIPLLMLLSLAFAGPAASIMLAEALIYCTQSRVKITHGSEGTINASGCNFNSFLRRTVRFVGVHVFGLCSTALVTDVIQLCTGYHTPFFLTVCKPNYTLPGVACNNDPYITQDICSGRDLYAIQSARKTFPSQHATLSGFAAVYISMYFNATISDSTKLLKPVLVFIFAIAAALASLTQITQYRCHPIDVYVGFVIGAGIAVYLALYAVGNFKPSEYLSPQPLKKSCTPKKDALRALTQRGHDSVYHKGHASESNDELAVPADVAGLNRKVQREKPSMVSLKRASADVELLAPRNPMGKETMLTFSNTLPRASANGNGLEEPAQRHMTFHVNSSKQLVSEWKQKSVEMRTLNIRDDGQLGGSIDEETNKGFKEELDMTSLLYPNIQAAAGSRVVVPQKPGAPPLVHIPEEASKPPPVSPKSATTRAKWLSMMEKGSPIPAATPELQCLANKVISSPKSSDTASSRATSSVASSSESPYFRVAPERDRCSIVTIDAHATHHPIVRLSSVSSSTWDWRSSTNGSMEIQETSRTMPRKEYRSVKMDSFGLEPLPPHPDLVPQVHRKPSIPAKEWDPEIPHPEPDHFFKKLQIDQQFKD